MSSIYSGVAGAPVTPFTSKGDVDYETYAKQINFLIENGVRLIVQPMHSGDAVSLTGAERRELAKVLASSVGRRVPTFINVSHAGTDIAADLAAHATRCGNTGVLLSAPTQGRPAQRALIEHFTAVAGAAGGESMIVNDPLTTGLNLETDTLEKLIDRLPGLVAVVDASADTGVFADLCDLLARKGKPIAAYGSNEMLLGTMPLGARGCISLCSEVAPRLTQALYQHCATGVYSRAQPLQLRVRRLLRVLTQNPPAHLKYAMELLDRPTGAARRPVLPPTADEKKWIKSELTQIGVFDEEPLGWEGKRKAAKPAA